MKLRSFISVCFGMLSCAVVTVSQAGAPADAPTTRAMSDPAKIIQVTKNNPQFDIKLASNPTTGYSWRVLSYDKHLLVLVNHVYQKPDSQLAGAGGKEIWTFKVTNNGFTTPAISKITMLYARPWNTKDNSKQVEFTVKTIN